MKTPFHYFLAGGMLITGSVNTLSTKAADLVEAENSKGYKDTFDHPFVQAIGMFIGEFSCLITFNILLWHARRTGKPVPEGKPFNRFLLAIPAFCDMLGTSIMYVGLNLTYASVFQMLRGSVVIFTGIFSVVFLKRKQYAYHWIGMALVLMGALVVGLSSNEAVEHAFGCSVDDSSTAPTNPTLGNILIVVAQVVAATQVVVEEKLISGYDLPALQVVGWEGFFGMTMMTAVVGIFYVIPKPHSFCSPTELEHDNCERLEDIKDAFIQIGNSLPLGLFLLGNICSIAFFNYFGVSVTKHLNSSTRMVLDSVRTLVIWGFSLLPGINWQTFCSVQVLGFAILLTGTLIYNAIFHIPGLYYPDPNAPADEAKQSLLDDESKLVVDGGEEGGASLNSDVGVSTPIPGLGRMQQAMSTPTMGRQTALKQR